jgi:hypothetical protein
MKDDVDRSYNSSPDPLALSMDENKTRSPRKTSPRKPFAATSPSKQNRRSSVSEFDFSSPSKSMIVDTPRMGGASPWRIKVTVQAEPGSDEENMLSPSVERVTRTTTTTVPLKDVDGSSPVKRGRGRPKKSGVETATKPRRTGTPAKRAKPRDASLGAADSSAADVDTDAPPKKRRGRPRKSVQPYTSDDEMLLPNGRNAQQNTATPVQLPATSSKIPSSRKNARFASPQAFFPAIENTDATSQPPLSILPQDKRQDGTSLVLLADRRKRQVMAEYELPVLNSPPPTELGNRLRARRGTPHSKKVVLVSMPSDEDSDEDGTVLTPTSGEEDRVPEEAVGKPVSSIAGQRMREMPVLEPSNQPSSVRPDMYNPLDEENRTFTGHFLRDGDNEFVEDANHFALDEGTTRMADDTTILESENFSMISVDSLPSSGGLTSPPQPDEGNAPVPQTGSMLRYEYLGRSPDSESSSQNQIPTKISTDPEGRLAELTRSNDMARPSLRRHITPAIDAAVPSEPPAIESVRTAASEAETPRLGRVVTAGVALQGLIDPSRLTPESSRNASEEKRDKLEDLFRGFSTGTKRELQAGLRLGEQLAQNQTKEGSSPARSSPIKIQPEALPRKSVFRTERKSHQSRLLTPEDQEDLIVAGVRQSGADDVQYPILDHIEKKNPLISPSGSEDEMSWRVDTPPVATGNTGRMHSLKLGNEHEKSVEAVKYPALSDASKIAQDEDYSDIWQEEASRSSNSLENEEVLPAQDLFVPGPVAPARGKLPRTWRRESGNHFQYSDEAESPQQVTPPRTVSAESIIPNLDDGEIPVAEEMEDEGAASDASDDTGMFFQSNMPSIFSKRHSQDLKRRKADKLDLTLLLNEGESFVPESSPPVATKASAATKTNPFVDTPPRFATHLSSPTKSSPLRRELRGSDISSESPSRLQNESSLPLPQSSPFHTYVDGESKLSVASDQRQLRMEMEGVTDSSIQRVRHEADQYLDAYEPQERSLNGITEITEPSRTWNKTKSAVASSPPQMRLLSPIRKRVPLFERTPEQARGVQGNDKITCTTEVNPTSASNRDVDTARPDSQPQQRPTGLLTRMTSSLWSAVTAPAAIMGSASSTPPAPHPILARLTPLPKIEPWTKTHYKTLDKIYSIQRKNGDLFSPSITPVTPLSITNTHLLNKFLSTTNQPYVGAAFSAFGYEFDMTEELIVVCAVFMELLTLENIKAYETLKGREIELGDCLPGRTGDLIEAEEVVRRLATVVLGEEVRRDEKKGIEIDRSQTLEVHWPQ